MKRSILFGHGFLFSLGVVAYVALVATLMSRAEAIFGEMNDVLGPVAFLLLFTLSAAIVGSLVFGRPAYLFLTGAKSEGMILAASTIGWLLVETVIVFFILVLR